MAAALAVLAGYALLRPTPGARDSRPAGESARAFEGPLPAAPGASQDRQPPQIKEKFARKYPGGDDWDTEVFNENASKQLKALGKLLAHPDQISPGDLSALAVPSYEGSTLRPRALNVVFDDGSVTVRRVMPKSDTPPAPNETRSGLAGLGESLGELAGAFAGAADLRTKFKVVQVQPQGESVTTEVYYESAGHSAGRSVQQRATWDCRWLTPDPGHLPQLTGIQVSDHTEVVGPAAGGELFADCTEAVLATNPSFAEQIVPGLDHWRARITPTLGIGFTGHQGLTVGDVNGDGLDDLYLCQPGGLPNRLFVQNVDGTATDVSAMAGVDILDYTLSALILDIDGDGDQDLVVATATDVFFLRNDGTGVFQPASVAPLPNVLSITAADYDNDTDLDVYVCCYVDPDVKNSNPLPYHDANNGRRNVLLRNEGDGQFIDVTGQVGLEVNNRRFSFSASWEDYDNDGDVDLYVANDFGRNNLYRNDSGFFTDVAADAGVEDISAGMSVSWADYNNDGLMDLYVSNMFSSAGNRITYQRRFKPAADRKIRAQFQRHARGNSLFENRGDGTFADVSAQAGVTMGRWAWSSNFIDFNNDGFEDLLVANGFVTNEDTKDL
ncbi:MAG: FG-GAP repeat domain-containing protein [Phycisphaerae bacterium]